ncbi:MAG: ureidoglycolate lyase [Phyllobacteriaceae bacterium]|nr:ureidoglycolate lyase [Phyllobacteriaceae bacterium]
MMQIIAKPLTREAFAPFGEVIETAAAHHYPINGGMAERFHDLAHIEAHGANARVLVSIFEGRPYALPLSLSLVERHPLGSQAFFPLGDRPWLVIVAPDTPDGPGAPQAFLARGDQGVNYPANQWHGVLTPFGAPQRFLVVDRGGDGVNLEEYSYATPFSISIESPHP